MATQADWLDEVKWDAQGLVPVIAQERGTGDVLMFAFMNREALAETAASGQRRLLEPLAQAAVAQGRGVAATCQQVHEIRLDCDNDVVLLQVTQLGHRARHRLPHRPPLLLLPALQDGGWQAVEPVLKDPERIYR